MNMQIFKKPLFLVSSCGGTLYCSRSLIPRYVGAHRLSNPSSTISEAVSTDNLRTSMASRALSEESLNGADEEGLSSEANSLPSGPHSESALLPSHLDFQLTEISEVAGPRSTQTDPHIPLTEDDLEQSSSQPCSEATI